MMTQSVLLRRLAAAGLALAMSLALAACFMLPGKFASTLDLRKDGRFAYAYKGEIFLLGLAKLAEMDSAGDSEFTPSACYKDEDGEVERECTTAEIDQQKQDWDEEQVAAAAKRKKDAEEMKAVFGGIDPSDPKAAEELAARLRRQAGWRAVTYKGDGLFEVDFAITGRIDHDFVFPTMERMPLYSPFVMLNRRADGSVRIDAPGFNGGSQTGNLGGLGALAALGAKEEKGFPKMPQIEGTFTLTTDGQILTNNTDEGPKKDAAGQRLDWTINARSTAAPSALVKLGG